MKLKLFRAAFFIIILIGAYSCNKCTKGNNDLSTFSKQIPEFTKLEMNISGNIYIRHSKEYSIEIQIDKNLQKKIYTEVKRKTLVVETTGCIKKYKSFDVYISAPDIETIVVNGSGSVRNMETLKSKNFTAIMNGSGKINMLIDAEKLKSEIHGSGVIKYKGKAENHFVSVSGSGSLKSYKLFSDSLNAIMTGSGVCEVTVNKILDAEIAGSGNLYYKGKAKKISTEITGSGQVKRDF